MAGKIRVFRCGDPMREHLAPVFAFAVRRVAAEEFRRNRPVPDRMLRFAFAAVEDDPFARIFAVLSSDLREERDESAVILHRPLIEGMIVALRALDADAEK